MKIKIVFLLLMISGLFYSFTIESTTITPPQEEDYSPFADPMPEPINGMPDLIKKIQYPAEAKKNGVEGRVIAMAYINENGGVDDVKIIRGLSGGCDEEVIKVVKGAKFKPGMKEGKPVKVKLTLPFTFKLS